MVLEALFQKIPKNFENEGRSCVLTGLGDLWVDDLFGPRWQGTQNHASLVGFSVYRITRPQPLLKILHPLVLVL